MVFFVQEFNGRVLGFYACLQAQPGADLEKVPVTCAMGW